jgi:hypothetical protein
MSSDQVNYMMLAIQHRDALRATRRAMRRKPKRELKPKKLQLRPRIAIAGLSEKQMRAMSVRDLLALKRITPSS